MRSKTGVQRLGGAAMWLLALAAPLLTPGSVVTDPLVGATPAPAATTPARQTATQSPPQPTAAVTPTPDGGPGQVAGAGPDYGEVGLVVAAALATLLALAGLRERVRVPSSIAADDPLDLPFPSPATRLVVASGTSIPTGSFRAAAERRFDLRVDVLVLPVLAQPRQSRTSWIEWHDAADAWLWHESWLRSASTVRAVEADGLVVAGDLAPAPGAVWTAAPGTRVAVLPVSDGVILSRPAVTNVGDLHRRWLTRVRVWRCGSSDRFATRLVLLQAVIGFPLAVGLPVAAFLFGVSAGVVAASLAPLAVGVLSAALRWVALDDLDRSTTMRLPIRRGVLVIVTGPLHAAVVWVAAVRGARGTAAVRVARGRLEDEAAA